MTALLAPGTDDTALPDLRDIPLSRLLSDAGLEDSVLAHAVARVLATVARQEFNSFNNSM